MFERCSKERTKRRSVSPKYSRHNLNLSSVRISTNEQTSEWPWPFVLCMLLGWALAQYYANDFVFTSPRLAEGISDVLCRLLKSIF